MGGSGRTTTTKRWQTCAYMQRKAIYILPRCVSLIRGRAILFVCYVWASKYPRVYVSSVSSPPVLTLQGRENPASPRLLTSRKMSSTNTRRVSRTIHFMGQRKLRVKWLGACWDFEVCASCSTLPSRFFCPLGATPRLLFIPLLLEVSRHHCGNERKIEKSSIDFAFNEIANCSELEGSLFYGYTVRGLENSFLPIGRYEKASISNMRGNCQVWWKH